MIKGRGLLKISNVLVKRIGGFSNKTRCRNFEPPRALQIRLWNEFCYFLPKLDSRQDPWSNPYSGHIYMCTQNLFGNWHFCLISHYLIRWPIILRYKRVPSGLHSNRESDFEQCPNQPGSVISSAFRIGTAQLKTCGDFFLKRQKCKMQCLSFFWGFKNGLCGARLTAGTSSPRWQYRNKANPLLNVTFWDNWRKCCHVNVGSKARFFLAR